MIYSETDFKIAITKGRSYGKNIDDFIKAHPNLFVVSEGEESAKRLAENAYARSL